MMNKSAVKWLAWLAGMLPVLAQANGELDACLLQALKTSPSDTTVAELELACAATGAGDAAVDVVVTPPVINDRGAADTVTDVTVPAPTQSAIVERIFAERLTDRNPFVITPHNPNYVLPVSYNATPNETPYPANNGPLDNLEMKFQLSLKLLAVRGLIADRGSLFFAYTNQSWWQAYNSGYSSPFRETNHEPEVFVSFKTDWEMLGFRHRILRLGLSHQSNGQDAGQSRSWNRVYADFIMERGNLYMSIKPWYRIPEEKKSSPTDVSGDDNPDIDEYMGYGEFRAVYKHNRHTFSMMLRDNLRSENHGAIELGWSYPITQRLRGYVQYFNGYGESLIDYNSSTNRFSIGLALTDWL